MNKHKLIIWIGLTILFMMGCGLFGSGDESVDCTDPEISPPFEIYISRCEDMRIMDFSSDGRHMVIYGRSESGDVEYILVDLETNEKILLNREYRFITDNLMGSYFGLYSIPNKEYLALDYIDIYTETDWETMQTDWIDMIEGGDKIYTRNDSYGYLLKSNYMNEELAGYVLDFGSGLGTFENQLLENGVKFERVQTQMDLCNNNCESPSGLIKYTSNDLRDLDGNVLIDLTGFSEEEYKFGSGWSSDGQYFYFYYQIFVSGGIYSRPNEPSGIARVQIPEEYWVTPEP